MNMFKKNGGFTLVELIVVIAILAILAAVAVPAYSGYITKANDAADTTALAAVKTAVMGALATKGTVTEIVVKTDANGAITSVTAKAKVGETETSYTLVGTTPAAEAADYTTFVGTSPVMKGSFKNATATWTSATSKWVATPTT